jgi:hypothetical protein
MADCAKARLCRLRDEQTLRSDARTRLARPFARLVLDRDVAVS